MTQVQTWADRSAGKSGQVRLSFYERREKQGWLSRGEQRLYWEQWCINLNVLQSSAQFEGRHAFEAGAGERTPAQSCCPCCVVRCPRPASSRPPRSAVRAQRRQRLQSCLEQCVVAVVQAVNDRKDHIPPVASSAVLTFPFDIALARSVHRRLQRRGVCTAVTGSDRLHPHPRHGPATLSHAHCPVLRSRCVAASPHPLCLAWTWSAACSPPPTRLRCSTELALSPRLHHTPTLPAAGYAGFSHHPLFASSSRLSHQIYIAP